MDLAKSVLAKFGLKFGSQKEFLRPRSAKPHYLTKLPFRKKYPRVFIFVGGSLSFLVFFSAPIYNFLFKRPEDFSPDDLLWNEEKKRGKTHVQVMIEHKEQKIKEKEEKLAAKAKQIVNTDEENVE